MSSRLKQSEKVRAQKLSQNAMRAKARYSANYMDYKKVITERSFRKDYRPRDPMVVYPRLRSRVAFANR